MGFRKVTLNCMGPACAVTTVCVGVIAIFVRFVVPLTRGESPRNE
jgi:hypothetical protein